MVGSPLGPLDTGQRELLPAPFPNCPGINMPEESGGNKRESLRGVTSWHIRLYFPGCSLLSPYRHALSLSVGRTRVLQPGKLQIIRSHHHRPSLLSSVIIVILLLLLLPPSTLSSPLNPLLSLNLSIHFFHRYNNDPARLNGNLDGPCQGDNRFERPAPTLPTVSVALQTNKPRPTGTIRKTQILRMGWIVVN